MSKVMKSWRTWFIALLILAALLVVGARSGALAGSLAHFPATDAARQTDPMSKVERSVLDETAQGGAASVQDTYTTTLFFPAD